MNHEGGMTGASGRVQNHKQGLKGNAEELTHFTRIMLK